MTHVNADLDHCPEAIGWHQVDVRGRCYWCRQQVEPPSPRPRRFTHYRADAADAVYRYFYDPDFGADKDDVYV